MVIRDAGEPAPRVRRRTPWGLLLCLLVIGAVAAKITGLADPLITRALQFLEKEGGRDMSSPATRMVGTWVSEDDPMFRRVCYHPSKELNGVGQYTGEAEDATRTVDYKIISEDKAGTNMAMWEYVQGVACFERVEYSIDWDGLKMTKKYKTKDGQTVCCTYLYVPEPPTP